MNCNTTHYRANSSSVPGDPTLDASITRQFVQEFTALHDEAAVLRARNATLRTRPQDVRAYFRSQFKAKLRPTSAAPVTPRPLRPAPDDDPYAF